MFDNLPNNNSGNANQDQEGNPGGPTNRPTGLRNDAPAYSPSQKFQASQSVDNAQVPVSAANRPSPFRPNVNPVEDMFSDTDRPEKPIIFQPKSTPPPIDQFGMTDPTQLDPYTGESLKAKNKTIVFALMLISFMLVLIAGGYAYKMFFMSIVPDVNELEVVEDQQERQIIQETNEVEENNEIEENVVQPPVEEVVKDGDGDGLSDEEEFQLGTNLQEADSDGDGLFDREEVKVYKTDPMDTDTDKDGFADGMEVKGGYNPNGDGKLFENNN